MAPREDVVAPKLSADRIVSRQCKVHVLDALGGPVAVRSHCDPLNYVGLAPQMVDNARPRGPLETEQWESVGSWS